MGVGAGSKNKGVHQRDNKWDVALPLVVHEGIGLCFVIYVFLVERALLVHILRDIVEIHCHHYSNISLVKTDQKSILFGGRPGAQN